MEQFWKLMGESVIVQSLLALTVIGVMAYMVCTSQQLPSEFWPILGLIIGYFFGAKTQQATHAQIRAMSGKEK